MSQVSTRAGSNGALPPALPQGLNRPLDPADLPFVTDPGERRGDMLYRKLGRTGETVSAIGLGGFHIGKKKLSDAESIALIRSAVDHGITFLDNCWDYNEGTSEARMGAALKDGEEVAEVKALAPTLE